MGLEGNYLHWPSVLICSISGHLGKPHLLHNVVIGNNTVIAWRVSLTHDALEAFTCKTNLVGRTLPQDRHFILSNRELASAHGNHAIDVDLNLSIINPPIIAVSNDGPITYVKKVRHKRLRRGRGGGIMVTLTA